MVWEIIFTTLGDLTITHVRNCVMGATPMLGTCSYVVVWVITLISEIIVPNCFRQCCMYVLSFNTYS